MIARTRGFTMVEILMVCSIILILAAIAVPNMVDAQTRSKVARVRADMRTITLAIEAYNTDNVSYPLPNSYLVDGKYDIWDTLVTPVSYLTQVPTDPFDVGMTYSYQGFTEENNPIDLLCVTTPLILRAKWWFVASQGPDLNFDFGNSLFWLRLKQSDENQGEWLNFVYDPTNGTVSHGNIYRSGGEGALFAARMMQQ